MPTIKIIQANTNLSDASLQQYSTVEALFAMAMANGIGITDDVVAGNAIQLPDYTPPKQVQANTQAQYNVIKTKTATPITLQTWVDVTIQETGLIDNLFNIVQLNNASITDDLIAGIPVITPLPTYLMKDTVLLLQVKKPASGLTLAQTNILLPGGIGYMQIQNNFKVS